MRPVRIPWCNFTYLGPREDIGDLPVQRETRPNGDTVVYAYYELGDADRAAIARGCRIRLGIHNMEPIPAVSLGVVSTPDPEPEAEQT